MSAQPAAADPADLGDYRYECYIYSPSDDLSYGLYQQGGSRRTVVKELRYVLGLLGERAALADELEAGRKAAEERDEWRDKITDALGLADDTGSGGVHRADLDTVMDYVTAHYEAYREHDECPVWCDECERWERPRTCEHCNGSGCDAKTALGAYSECEWCAGDGRSHSAEAQPAAIARVLADPAKAL